MTVSALVDAVYRHYRPVLFTVLWSWLFGTPFSELIHPSRYLAMCFVAATISRIVNPFAFAVSAMTAWASTAKTVVVGGERLIIRRLEVVAFNLLLFLLQAAIAYRMLRDFGERAWIYTVVHPFVVDVALTAGTLVAFVVRDLRPGNGSAGDGEVEKDERVFTSYVVVGIVLCQALAFVVCVGCTFWVLFAGDVPRLPFISVVAVNVCDARFRISFVSDIVINELDRTVRSRTSAGASEIAAQSPGDTDAVQTCPVAAAWPAVKVRAAVRRPNTTSVVADAAASKKKIYFDDDVNNGDNDCVICCEPMTKKVAVTPCGHLFHRHCLSDAFSVRHACPLCVRNIRDEKEILRRRIGVVDGRRKVAGKYRLYLNAVKSAFCSKAKSN